jgi:hypothetical protein
MSQAKREEKERCGGHPLSESDDSDKTADERKGWIVGRCSGAGKGGDGGCACFRGHHGGGNHGGRWCRG